MYLHSFPSRASNSVTTSNEKKGENKKPRIKSKKIYKKLGVKGEGLQRQQFISPDGAQGGVSRKGTKTKKRRRKARQQKIKFKPKRFDRPYDKIWIIV